MNTFYSAFEKPDDILQMLCQAIQYNTDSLTKVVQI